MAELISISIPTRNRANTLHDLLSDISSSVAFGEVDLALLKIYIFDNDSNDNTEQVVRSFKSKLPISYVKNEKNIGMGLNIFKAYTEVNGEYVWVIGDDELLPISSISNVIKHIKKSSPALIILRELSYKGFVNLPAKYDSYEDFARGVQYKNPHYLIAHSLISSNVLKRSFFDKKAAMDAMDTYYGHMYGIASGLQKNGGQIYLAEEETILVRKVYLGPVDGFWPDTIDSEQVIYLKWLRDKFGLLFNPEKVIPDYRAKLMPNFLMRAINYIIRRIARLWSRFD